MTDRIRLLIADDNPVVRDGLRGMLSSQPDYEIVGEASTGYLLKDAPREELFRAIRSTARGESVLTPTVASRLMGRMRAPAEQALSVREIEVLTLVASGANNKEAAKRLHISEATVKSHLIHIFAKLGVSDRTQAVTTAIQRGIVQLD